MNDLNTLEVSDICKNCGMCCDGTLFEGARIFTENDKKLVENLGLKIRRKKEKFSFQLPCNLYDNCCTIYNKPKPSICNSFFCAPLLKYKNEEISLKFAHSQILITLKLKRDVSILSKKYDELSNYNWVELRSKLDEILSNSEPNDLKKFGIILLAYTNFILKKKIISDKPNYL